jgi:effector-binding domain-containing protein
MPTFTIFVALMFLISSTTFCAAQPTTKPAAAGKQPYAVTPMRVQELKGFDTFAYVESETSFADLHPTIDKQMRQINEAINTGKFQPDGPVIFIYKNVIDMSKPFTLQIGMPAKRGVQAAGDLKVRKLDPLRSATITYSGSVDDIPKPYEQLFKDLATAGLTPTGENREVYAYWEGPDSVNNVVVIQIGVK